jgi:catechol 2,3-dioxygenase
MTDSSTATTESGDGAQQKRARPAAAVGINHLVLNVHNMEESHHFWSDLLGFEQVGELFNPNGDDPSMRMRFYSGVNGDELSHHDLALIERKGLPEVVPWNMMTGVGAINHIAITFPDQESWLAQMEFLREEGVHLNLRMDHGMTHSLYINDPNGYGVEVLYDLPRDVWGHDINGALSYAIPLPNSKLLEETERVSDFPQPYSG